MSVSPPSDLAAAATKFAPRGFSPLLVRIGIGLGVLLVALAIHWNLVLDGHRKQLISAESKMELRSAQLAHALALQVGTLVADIDYLTRTLSDVYTEATEVDFARVEQMVLDGLPQDSVVRVAVADAHGRILYSSAGRAPDGSLGSIEDRADFRFHVETQNRRVYVGEPVREAATGLWAVDFSRALVRNGRFAGVLLLSISPDYLSRSFNNIFPDERDVILLARNDGVFLARSVGFEGLIGGRATTGYAFMRESGAQSGRVLAVSAVDGILRQYAFHRVEEYPLTVSVGLDAARDMAAVRDAIDQSRLENAVASLLLLLAAIGIGWMFVLRERDVVELAESRERLGLALAGGDLGTWDWNVATGQVRFNERWAQMLGYGLDELAPGIATWEQLVHPDDWEVIDAALKPHLAGKTPHYESEHRMRHRDGHWVWVLDRGRVVERAPDGAALRAVGTHLDITPRKQAESLEAESRERLARLVSEVPGAVFQYLQRSDGTACVPYASPGIGSVYGVSADEVADSADPIFARIHPDDLDHLKASIRESAADLSPWRCEYRVLDEGEGVRWLLGHANPQRLEDGATLWHGYIYDVTEQHHAAAELESGRLCLTALIERFPGGVLMEDAEGAVVVANQALCELFGMRCEAHQLIGVSHSELAVQLGPERAGWLHQPGSGGRENRRSKEIQTADGRSLEVDWVPIERDAEPLGRVWLVRDISDRKARELELETLATTDTLTGLPNRRSFLSRLEQTLIEGRRSRNEEGVVMMLDIDHFKRVNDQWGHGVGDEVLQHFATVVRHCLRRGDVAGRLGGEEFAVLLPRTGIEDGRALAERLREQVEVPPAATTQGAVAVTVSIGVCGIDGLDAAQILHRADQALYAAKSAGRNRVCVADSA